MRAGLFKVFLDVERHERLVFNDKHQTSVKLP